ncbi:MAG: GIY-YIG nuclease family protein [Methanoregulaceae archaeon]|nr:GIY-YIG nuclease family protein [Methanoregulaceae archaeon]
MYKGIYCLFLRNSSCTVTIGALGPVRFDAGWHVYIGSALGPGGLARVRRHLRYSGGEGGRPRWHIDYLLRHPSFAPGCTCCAGTNETLECRIAESVGGTPVPRFGSSDCDCRSHLFHFQEFPKDRIESAFRSLGLVPIITMLNTNEGQS